MASAFRLCHPAKGDYSLPWVSRFVSVQLGGKGLFLDFQGDREGARLTGELHGPGPISDSLLTTCGAGP